MKKWLEKQKTIYHLKRRIRFIRKRIDYHLGAPEEPDLDLLVILRDAERRAENELHMVRSE